MKLLIGFLRFWNDLIIGDCWQIAVGIALLLGAGIGLLRFQLFQNGLLPILLGAGVMVLVPLIVVFEARAALRTSRVK
jgi:hypothetical protein